MIRMKCCHELGIKKKSVPLTGFEPMTSQVPFGFILTYSHAFKIKI